MIVNVGNKTMLPYIRISDAKNVVFIGIDSALCAIHTSQGPNKNDSAQLRVYVARKSIYGDR